MSRRLVVHVTQIALIAGGLIGYEVGTRTQLLDPFTFVPLTTIVETLIVQLGERDYLTTVLAPTGLAVLVSFAASAAIGIVGGILLWRSDYLHYVLEPYLLIMYAIPSFAFYPLLISIVGMGPPAVVVTAIIGATPAVIINTAIGFRETPEVLVRVGRAICPRPIQIVRHVYFPAAWPHIFTGLRLAGAFTIIIVLATEFMLSTRGLGHDIAFDYNNFDLPHMYASILLVNLLALATVAALTYMETRVHRRGGR